jgi:hypothetical protein
MPQLITQLVSCHRVLRAEDKEVLHSLLSFAPAAGGRRYRGDCGLKEKSIYAIGSHSQLDSQQALCLLEPLLKLQDISPWGGLNRVQVGRAFC